MKKLTLALVVGVMYLGTQATVVFAEPTTGENKVCKTCEATATNTDPRQPTGSDPSGTKKQDPAKNKSSGMRARSDGKKN